VKERLKLTERMALRKQQELERSTKTGEEGPATPIDRNQIKNSEIEPSSGTSTLNDRQLRHEDNHTLPRSREVTQMRDESIKPPIDRNQIRNSEVEPSSSGTSTLNNRQLRHEDNQSLPRSRALTQMRGENTRPPSKMVLHNHATGGLHPSNAATRTANPVTNTKSVFLPPDTITSITFSNLQVAPYKVIRLLDVKTTHSINEHGTLYFKALLSEEQQDQYVESNTEGQNVALSVVDPEGHHYILFQGIVNSVKVSEHQDLYHLEVEAVSYSYLLDLKQKSRSFQCESMTYEELFEQVTAGHKNAGVIDQVSGGATLNQLILQYKETDFEFATRLASHFNEGLIGDVRFNSPKYYVGLPPSKVVTLNHVSYTVQKDMKRFRRLSKSGVKGLRENDFISYEVVTDQTLQVGSQVSFKGKILYVISIIGRVDRGVFMNHCVLMPRNGLKQRRIEHEKVVGCSFNGKIIDIKNDRVKIHLDMDKEQGVSTACYFPYSTIYSSEDGSGWYCMPELSDSVRLYVPDGNEGHAYAISSVHEPVSATPPTATQNAVASANVMDSGGSAPSGTADGPSGGMMREDPDIKSLRSACGKVIELSPEGILVDEGSSKITLKPDDGIVLYSEKDIKVNAQKNIVIKAEEEVQIVGEESVKISASDLASVEIDDDVAIIGYEVRSN